MLDDCADGFGCGGAGASDRGAYSCVPGESGARAGGVGWVACGGGRAGNLQFTDRAFGDRLTVFIDETNLVTRHRLAGRSVAHVPWAVRQKDMQHLRRAESIEDVHASVLAPALSDFRRQRFAGRSTATQMQLLAFG